MSRESESHVSLTPALVRRPWAFGSLPAFASTRRGKVTLGIVAAALLGAGTLSTASYMGADVAGQVAKKAQSFMSLMKQRSPGARTGDMLIKTKGRKYAVLAASVPAPQSAASPTAAPETPAIEFAPGPAPVSQLAQLGPIFAPPLGPMGFTPPWGGGGGPPPPFTEWPPPDCCSGGVGPPAPPGPPGPPGPPPPGVPEPATWAMMLLGFATTGWSIRGRRARAARLSACA